MEVRAKRSDVVEIVAGRVCDGRVAECGAPISHTLSYAQFDVGVAGRLVHHMLIYDPQICHSILELAGRIQQRGGRSGGVRSALDAGDLSSPHRAAPLDSEASEFGVALGLHLGLLCGLSLDSGKTGEEGEDGVEHGRVEGEAEHS